jgi:hypothetical protein
MAGRSQTRSSQPQAIEFPSLPTVSRWPRFRRYIGAVPSEATIGQQRRFGSITKMGFGHAGRLLVEAAWHYRIGPSDTRL